MANKTRRNKKRNVDINTAAESPNSSNGANIMGGKRRGKKTRRASKGASDWNKKVMKVYHDMKRKDKSVRLGDAMKRASQMKKRGEL
uniref:Uncharacterized protein n=1 Tax=viral metagenome TaxID=1070528 RepID=A0A6C0KT31_9ZZZZ